MTMFPAAQPGQQQLVKRKQQHQQNYVYDARLSSCRLVDEGRLYNNIGTSCSPSNNPVISREVVHTSSMGDQQQEEVDPDHSTTNSSTNETGGGSTTSNTTTTANFIFDYTKQRPKAQQQRHISDDDDDDDGGWLRLGMGGCEVPRSSSSPGCHPNQTNNSVGSAGGGLMLELNLLPAPSSTTTLSFQQQQQASTAYSSSSGGGFMVYHQTPQVLQQDHQGAGGWASYLRSPKLLSPAAAAAAFASSSSSNSSLLQLQQPPHPHPPHPQPDIRFIPPPRRPHSGIWFMLLPSFNQVTKQPSLPQLPKNYLRIKDGRMTVGLLIKYLVNKLGLDTESQVEIRCRGMELEGSLTMQHVRDRIWTTTTTATTASSSSSYPPPVVAAAAAHHHIMLLHYATRTTTA